MDSIANNALKGQAEDHRNGDANGAEPITPSEPASGDGHGEAQEPSAADGATEPEKAESAPARPSAQVRKPLRPPAAPKRRQRPSRRDLPTVTFDEQDFTAAYDEAWDAIHEAVLRGDLLLFQNPAGEVAHLIEGPDGRLQTRRLNERLLFLLLGKVAVFAKRSANGEVRPARPNVEFARQLLYSPEKPLPVLRRLARFPIHDAEGNLSEKPGYNPATETFLALPASFEPLDMPPAGEPLPSECVEWARDFLLGLLSEFSWADESGPTHAIAAMLVPTARDLIRAGGTPLFLAWKPAPASGGTLLGKVISLVATGEPPASFPDCGGDEEWRKRISAALEAGSPSIQFDNLHHELNSAALCSALTTEVWTDRRLGSASLVSVPVQCLWQANANNPQVSSEIARRSILLKLDRSREPEGGFSDVVGAIRERQREAFLALAFLVRNWIDRGRPEPCAKLKGYESFSEVVGGIVEAAGLPGFLANAGELEACSDPEGEATRSLVELWFGSFGGAAVGTRELYPIVYNLDPGIDLGGGSERSQKKRLGHFLRRLCDNEVLGFKVIRSGKSEGRVLYRLVEAPRAEAVDEAEGAGEPAPSRGEFPDTGDEFRHDEGDPPAEADEGGPDDGEELPDAAA